MFTKEKNFEKICSFYASDYHLEMIMIPYINKKIEEQANVEIITEKNLTKSVEEVVSKINIPQERKNEIMKIGWSNNDIENLRKNEKNGDKVIFVVGRKNYIESINKEINNMSKDNSRIKVVNCYNLEDAQSDMPQIVANHSKILNTIEEKEID